MSRAGCVLLALLAVGLVSGSAAALPTTYRDEVLADNPAGYWRLNEASGTSAIEEIAGINGTYTGGVSLGQPGALTSDSANKAASFDGIDDSMSVANAGALSMSSAVSIEVWVKRTRTGVFQAIAGKPTTGNSKLENYSLWLTPSNQVRMYVGNGSAYAQVTSPAALNTNWHHIVGTFDNATMRLYVDGGQVASTTTSVRLTPNANPFFVARSSSSSSTNFGGLLDELAVYATALPAARIQAHYNKAFADLTPPVVTLTQPPNGSFRTSSTVVFGGVAGNAAGDSATVSVKIYVGGTPTGTPAQTLTATRQGNNSYSASTSLADGQWTAQAEQSDAGGNTGQSSANTFVVDTIAPVTTIASTPVSPTNETTATFGFFASEPAVLACRLDGGAFGSCTSPQGYSGLLEGSHTFEVRATDTAGNTGPVASFTWTIDTTAPPTPTITSAPPNPSGSTTASFSFTDGDATAGLLCQLDGGGFSSCTSPRVYESLAFATHTFEVKARDPAGNESSAASYTWTIDLGAPPPPTITSGPPDPSASPDATFDFIDDDLDATFECSLDDDSYAPCTSPAGYTGLADGSHTFSVRALGSDGMSAATSYAWTIITVAPPAPTITSTPPDPSSSTSASFGFSGSPGVSFALPTGRRRVRVVHESQGVLRPRGDQPHLRGEGTRRGREREPGGELHLDGRHVGVGTTDDHVAPAGSQQQRGRELRLRGRPAGLHLRVRARRRRVLGLREPPGLRLARGREPHIPRAGDRRPRQRRPGDDIYVDDHHRSAARSRDHVPAIRSFDLHERELQLHRSA